MRKTVKCLASEPMRNRVEAVMGTACSRLARP
jgi:hypothetical protein